jgi:hypothetical protein
VPTAVSVLWIVFWMSNAFRGGLRGRPGGRLSEYVGAEAFDAFAVMGGVLLLVWTAFLWILPSKGAVLEFARAEIHFLFPAPVTRRQIVHYKLMRAQTGIFFGALITSFFWGRGLASAGGWGRLLGIWLLYATLHLHTMGAGFVRSDLLEQGVSGLRRRIVPFLALVAFVIVAFGFRQLMQRLEERDRWHVALIWLALCGLGADWSGLHYMVGAFLAGAAIDRDWFDQDRLDSIRHNVLLVMMPVFFLSTGLRTEWQVGGAQVFLAAAMLLVASIGGKLIGTGVAGRLLRWQPGEASLIGWLLQTKALIMIIFANILLDKAVITASTFTALLLMAVGSTMLTIPVVTPRLTQLRHLIGKTD